MSSEILHPSVLSVDDSDKGNLFYAFMISTIAALGGLMYGFVIGVISGANLFVTEYFKLTTYQVGLTVGILDIGCIIGSLAAGFLSDKYGRKKVLIFNAVLFILSGILTAIPHSFVELLIGRFIGGIAVGASMISALYIAEVSPARIRGILVTFTQFAIVIGILLTYCLNWLLVDVGPENWRWMFGCGIIPSVIFLISLVFVPESPRWLAKQGKTGHAFALLSKIGGTKHAQTELAEITTAVEHEKGSVKELFKPGLRQALIIGILISIFAQSVGINSVIYYAPIIFMAAGYESASSALLSSVIIGAINFIFTVIAIFTIDRFGRKPILIFGLCGMMVSMFLIGFSFQASSHSTSWILIPILAFVASYSVSLGPIAWVIVSEIFPTKIRGVAMAISMTALYLSDFSISFTFPWMIENIKGNTFYLFTMNCLLALLFVLFMVKETKGKTLEEIEKMWERQAYIEV